MSYGFEIRNASNEVVLDSSDTTFRIKHVERCEWNFTGTITVNNFDSNNGYYYVKPIFTMISSYANGFAIKSAATSLNYDFTSIPNWQNDSAGGTISGCSQKKPTLSWNNSTKVMTVTSTGLTPNGYQSMGGSYGAYYDVNGHYDLVFFEVS